MSTRKGFVALALFAFIGAGVVANLNAGSPRAGADRAFNPDLRTALASDELKKSLQRHAEELKKLARASEHAELPDLRVPKNLRKAKLRPFVIEAAVGDGKLVYARTTKTVPLTDVIVSLGALPLEVIERDIATGDEKILFKSSAVGVNGLKTRAGTTVFDTTRYSFEREAVVIDSSVMLAAPGGGAKVVASDTMRVDFDRIAFCGATASSVVLNESGATLMSKLVGTCGLANEITTEARLIGADGSESKTSFEGSLGLLGESAIAFGHGRLLSTDSTSEVVGLYSEGSDAFTPLINGGVNSASMAADGTVAAAMNSGYSDFPGSSDSPSPLVIFPQGDPDRITVMSRRAGKVRNVQFCADNLYVVKRMSSVSRDLSFLNLGVTFNWMSRSRATYRVLLYDRNGGFVKNLGDTPNMELAAVGCEAGMLNLVAQRSNDATLLRYAP